MFIVRRLFTLMSLCAASLALTVPVARGQVSTLRDSYTITYKDLNTSIQPVVGASSITITDPTAMGSLKIVKKKGVTSYPRIDLIATSGTLTQVLTQGNVLELRATGDILAVTSTKAHLHTIKAREIGSVKMADLARSHSTWGSEVFFTSLYSYGSGSQAGIAAAPLSLSARKLQVNLTGVSLLDCYAPTQEAQIKLASKSWKNPEKAKDVSLAAIPRRDVTPSVGNAVVVGHLSLLSVVGGGGYPNTGSICPNYIQCYGLANKPSKIVGKDMVFTFTSHYTVGKASTDTYKTVYTGTLFPLALYSNASKLDIQVTGGDVKAASEMIVKGSIGKITAQVRRLVSKSEGHNYVSLIGGYYSVPLLQTGTNPYTFQAATAAGPADIGLIKADLGLNWEMTWAYENGQYSYVPLPHPDYTLRAGQDGQGKIGVLQSLKAGSKSLGSDMLQAGGPYICGRGFAAAPGVITGGVYDGFFTWNPIL